MIMALGFDSTAYTGFLGDTGQSALTSLRTGAGGMGELGGGEEVENFNK